MLAAQPRPGVVAADFRLAEHDGAGNAVGHGEVIGRVLGLIGLHDLQIGGLGKHSSNVQGIAVQVGACLIGIQRPKEGAVLIDGHSAGDVLVKAIAVHICSSRGMHAAAVDIGIIFGGNFPGLLQLAVDQHIGLQRQFSHSSHAA